MILEFRVVFGSTSFAPGEDWRWQTHLMNLPVYYEYKADGVDNLDAIEFKYNKTLKYFDLYLNIHVQNHLWLDLKLSRNLWQNLQWEM